MLPVPDVNLPTEHEAQLAAEASKSLAVYLKRDLVIQVEHEGKPGAKLILPKSAIRLLADILNEMAAGNAVTLSPIQAELSVADAARWLDVPQTYLSEMLDSGSLAFRKDDAERYIGLKDLLSFQQKHINQRMEALDELVKLSQELNMGY